MNDCGAFKYVARFANILCINHIHCIYFLYSAETFQYNIISNVIFDFILTWRKLSFRLKEKVYFKNIYMTNLISLWYKGWINLCYSVGSHFRHLLLVIIFLSIYIFATLLLIRTNIISAKCVLICWQISYNLEVEVTFLNTFHDFAHHLEETI